MALVKECICVSFVISSSDNYIEEITDILGLAPTAVINKKDIALTEFQHYEWQYSIERESKVLTEVFDSLLDEMELIKERIIYAVNLCDGRVCIVVTIHANEDNPEVILNRRIINFLFDIGAEIHFDLYYD